MKKTIYLIITMLFLITGCKMDNTPSKAVEKTMAKYQSMDSKIISQLDTIISSDITMTDEQQIKYKNLMERQYQNMTYKITKEEIEDQNAVVYAEIEVYDYGNSIKKSREYYEEHKEEFKDEKENNIDGVLSGKFIDYKLKQLENATERIYYEIKFDLEYKNNEWHVKDLSDNDIEKIHGLYEK